MDPAQALTDALAQLRAGDYTAAAEHLEDYAAWRGRDGFQPVFAAARFSGISGDALHQLLSDSLTLALHDDPEDP